MKIEKFIFKPVLLRCHHYTKEWGLKTVTGIGNPKAYKNIFYLIVLIHSTNLFNHG